MNSNLALLNAEAQQVPPIAHLHSTDSFGFHDLLFKAPIVPLKHAPQERATVPLSPLWALETWVNNSLADPP